jgi:serine protease Do
VFEFVLFSDEPARIGDWILAVGNPFGLGGTVSLGIVSALGRDIGAGPYDDFMQLDAAINRGNSGGPAFNLDGEVIGVNTAIASPTGASVGIGFAIPAHIVTEVVADLQDDGIVQRGWLGVQIQAITPDIAEALGLGQPGGALVVSAMPDGPAARAGLRSEDAILAVEDEAVEDPRQLARLIASYDPGQQIRLTVWRDGAETPVDVVLGELPGETPPVAAANPEAQTPPAAVEGIGLAIAPAADVGAGPRGVVVAMVDANGTAAQSGLQPGDVIIEVDGQPVDTLTDFAGALAEARNANESVVLLRVISGDAEGYVSLRLN